MPVEVAGHRGTVLLEPIPNLIDVLCIEDSLLEVDRNGIAAMVASNASKTSHVLKKGEELGTVQEVSILNSPKLSVTSQVQAV